MTINGRFLISRDVQEYMLTFLTPPAPRTVKTEATEETIYKGGQHSASLHAATWVRETGIKPRIKSSLLVVLPRTVGPKSDHHFLPAGRYHFGSIVPLLAASDR